MVDTNSDPDLPAPIIPCNDASARTIQLITSQVADAIIEGNAEREARKEEELMEQVADEERETEEQEASAESEVKTRTRRRKRRRRERGEDLVPESDSTSEEKESAKTETEACTETGSEEAKEEKSGD